MQKQDSTFILSGSSTPRAGELFEAKEALKSMHNFGLHAFLLDILDGLGEVVVISYQMTSLVRRKKPFKLVAHLSEYVFQ